MSATQVAEAIEIEPQDLREEPDVEAVAASRQPLRDLRVAFVGNVSDSIRNEVADAGATVVDAVEGADYVVCGALAADGSMVVERTAAYQAAATAGRRILDEDAMREEIAAPAPAEDEETSKDKCRLKLWAGASVLGIIASAALLVVDTVYIKLPYAAAAVFLALLMPGLLLSLHVLLQDVDLGKEDLMRAAGDTDESCGFTSVLRSWVKAMAASAALLVVVALFSTAWLAAVAARDRGAVVVWAVVPSVDGICYAPTSTPSTRRLLHQIDSLVDSRTGGTFVRGSDLVGRPVLLRAPGGPARRQRLGIQIRTSADGGRPGRRAAARRKCRIGRPMNQSLVYTYCY